MAYETTLKGVGLRLKQLLDDNKTALGFNAIYFGDTSLKPSYPTAVVRSNTLSRAIKGTRKFSLVMTHDIVLSVFKMGDPKGREEDIHDLVDAVEAVLGTDRTLGGSVIFAFVTTQDMVDIETGSVVSRGVAMTVESWSQETF